MVARSKSCCLMSADGTCTTPAVREARSSVSAADSFVWPTSCCIDCHQHSYHAHALRN